MSVHSRAIHRAIVFRYDLIDNSYKSAGQYDPVGVERPAGGTTRLQHAGLAKIPFGEFAIDPVLQSGQLPTEYVAPRLCSAYSLTAMSASVADLRSLASTVITGMFRGRVSASRTASTG